MRFSQRKEMLKVINNESNIRLKQISKKEINKIAKSEKIRILPLIIFGLIVLLGSFTYLLVSLLKNNIHANFSMIFVTTLLGILSILLIIFCLKELFLSDEKIVLQTIKKDLKPIIKATYKIPDNNFCISKIVNIKNGSLISQKFYIDKINKKFIYQKGKNYSKTYDFANIINYEVYENGYSQIQGTAGRAFVGGLFFGITGAIIGSSASRKIDEKCNNLQLIIRLIGTDINEITINYVLFRNYNKTDSTYINKKLNLKEVCSELEYMLNLKYID